MTDKLRMEAYYYGFDRTGVAEIDKILSAVAWAGTSFHLTEDWCDNAHARPPHTGQTPIEWIQNAACEAAGKWKERVGNWQPIDTAPKDGTSILVMNNDQPGCEGGVADECWAGNTAVAEWWGDSPQRGKWVCFMGMVQNPDLHFKPTHWMPTPDPPSKTTLPEGPKE